VEWKVSKPFQKKNAHRVQSLRYFRIGCAYRKRIAMRPTDSPRDAHDKRGHSVGVNVGVSSDRS
jgi:hypothetical protein